jgi:CDP-diacylglycerol--glycerol-3-phosphate 3-phosphatidyltransferase
MIHLQTRGTLIIASILIGIIFITDALDGFIARRFNKQSELGLILDPVCDKTVTIVLLTLFVIYIDFPLWVLLLILIRDILILFGNWFFAIRKSAIFRSGFFGKWAFIILSITIMVYSLHWFSINAKIITDILLYLMVLFMIASLVQYSIRFLSEWKRRNNTISR